MTARDYKPGTVAAATVRGVPNVRAFRLRERTWVTGQEIQRTRLHHDEDVTDVRPLVTLDPAESPEPLNGTYAATFLDAAAKVMLKDGGPTREIPFLRWLADQIEAQTKPPKPEVYEHLAAPLESATHVALCGKFWRPNDRDAVTVVGRCPECATLAESGWTA